jgi:hypothetical protein
MKSLLVSLLLTIGISTAAAADAQSLPDGTLLFLENCSSVVEHTTHGKIGHVAIVFHDGQTPVIFEATPAKVRRVTLEEYTTELARLNQRKGKDEQIRAWVLEPKADYTADEVPKMKSYLETQLGRRYSVKNYVRGQEYDGIQCAELASSTLNQSGRYAFEDCFKINPQALYTAVLPTHAAPELLTIPPLAVQEPWSLRTQRRLSGWCTWCGWSCREAWAWCW